MVVVMQGDRVGRQSGDGFDGVDRVLHPDRTTSLEEATCV